PAEAGGAVHRADGAWAPGAGGAAGARTAGEPGGPGRGRVAARGAGASPGDLAGYVALVAAEGVARRTPRRRRALDPVGGCRRGDPPARAARPAPDVGEPGAAGAADQAEASPGPVMIGTARPSWAGTPTGVSWRA